MKVQRAAGLKRWAAFEFMLMKPIIQGVMGGVLVMAAAAMGFVLGGGRHFMWVMAWPALLLRPLFPLPLQIRYSRAWEFFGHHLHARFRNSRLQSHCLSCDMVSLQSMRLP